MKKIFLIISVVFIVFVLFFYNEPTKVYKIGVLSHAKIGNVSLKGFKDNLKNFGFIEGENVKYYYDGPTGDVSSLPAASKKLIKQNVDMILTLTTPAGLQAQIDTKTNKIPVVFAPASNPVGSGLVESINSPGENITGVTFGLQEVKRLEWLLKILPNTKKIYYPYNDKDISPSLTLKKLQKYLDKTDIEIITKKVYTKEDITNSFKDLPKDIDVVFIATDALVASNLKLYLEVFNKLKIPITVAHRKGVEQGSFMSFGFSMYELGFQAARISKEIINGINPGDIPVENSEFKLSFNAKSMEELKIDVSENILVQAIIVK